MSCMLNQKLYAVSITLLLSKYYCNASCWAAVYCTLVAMVIFVTGAAIVNNINGEIMSPTLLLILIMCMQHIQHKI